MLLNASMVALFIMAKIAIVFILWRKTMILYKNITDELEILANIKEYEKIILKCEEKDREYCLENGYIEEAEIPRFFNGKNKCYIMSKFINKKREASSQLEQIIEVLFKAKAKPLIDAKQMEKGYDIRILKEEHIEKMNKNLRRGICELSFSDL